MIGKKFAKAFGGAIGAGLPFEDFETGIEKPESVVANLAHLKPMIKAVSEMAKMPGWTDYIRPFLEKQGDARKLLALIREKKDPGFMAAKVETYQELLNYVNSLTRTADSLARLEAEEAESSKAGNI